MNRNIRIARELVRMARMLASSAYDQWAGIKPENAAVIVMDWLMRNDPASYYIIKARMKEPGFTEETDRFSITYSVNGSILLHACMSKRGSKTAIDFECLGGDTKTIMPED